jgi:hypothetical protein
VPLRVFKKLPETSSLSGARILEEGIAARGRTPRIGGVGLQIVRDWVLRFNAEGPDGLSNRKAPGTKEGVAFGASLASERRPIARVKDSFVMRRAKLTGGLCPNDRKNIVPRHRPPLRRQRRAKSRQRPGNPRLNYLHHIP